MPQAAVTYQIFFGNNVQPNGQGVLSWIDLNDSTNWSCERVDIDSTERQIFSEQRALRTTGVYLRDDYGPRKILLSSKYYETNAPLGAAKAKLQQAGEQYLSLDNKATAILAKVASFGTPQQWRNFAPLVFQVPLEFFAVTPWFVDQAQTTSPNALAVAGSGGAGTATNFNITYAGTIFAAPLFTLHVPATNTQAITTVKLQNTMSGELLTWTGSMSASTVHDLVFDCNAFTAALDATPQDVTGSFPQLYGPAGQVNTFTCTIVAAGATTGLTLTGTYYNRWDI